MKKEFYINNRKKYYNNIKDNSLTVLSSGCVLRRSADEDFDFEIDKNFYYLTGINQAEVLLILLKKNNEIKEILFIEENDPIKIKWVGAKLYPNEASDISGIEEVHYLSEYEAILEKNLAEVDDVYLNFEVSKSHRFNSNYVFSHKLKKKYPDKNYLDNNEIVVALRSVKEKEEVEKIQESIAVTKLGIEELMKNSRPGIYEYQLESYFDFVVKNNGQRITSFKTIAASGINATILHYVANNSILNDNELILFDLGCETDFYISDISRTFPINGKFTERQKEVYNEVLNVNKKCIEFLKPGVTRLEYNNYAKKLLAEACKRLGLIDKDEDLVKYYFHGIGHSIGLDTHDPCVYDPQFKEGMMLTVEPGLYIPEEKIGIRIEDNILITKDGCINLSADIIKEVDDIENFFRKNNSYNNK